MTTTNRNWMYERLDSRGHISHDFIKGVETFIEFASDLKKRWGYAPTNHELYLYTHTKNHDGTTFLVEKAKKIHDDFKERCEQLEAIGEEVNEDQLFYNVVGAHDRKRRLYGFGSYGKSIRFKKGSSETNDSLDTNVDKDRAEIENLKNLVETQREQYEDIQQKYEDVQKNMRMLNNKMWMFKQSLNNNLHKQWLRLTP